MTKDKLYNNLITELPSNDSIMDALKMLDPERQKKILDEIVATKYPDRGYLGIKYDKDLWLRPSQLLPFDFSKPWKTFVVQCGRGFGKGAALDTPIPTPSGWTAMGNIEVGDEVFDEMGNICNVTGVTDTYIPNKAYKFIFSDGTGIVVCDEHQWVTMTRVDRKEGNISASWALGQIKTTQDIVNTFRIKVENNDKEKLNHCIPLAAAFKLPEKKLKLDPYLYGLILEDGITDSNTDDSQFYSDFLTSRGINLKKLKALADKTVQPEYLRGSVNQRVDFLNGLLDFAGCISKTGLIKFTSTSKEIVELVYELLISLGEKPTIHTKIGKLYGVEKKLAYRITFTPNRADYFYLPRKRAILTDYRARYANKQSQSNLHRMIVSYEEVAPVPMRCIQVDSRNSMYLIGKQALPTHNTRTSAEWIRWLVTSRPNIRVGVISPTDGDAVGVMINGESGLLSVCAPWERANWQPSYKRVVFPNGSVVQYFAATEPDRLRGPQFHYLACDEFAAWGNMKDTYQMASFGLRLGNDPRLLITTTPRNIEVYKNILAEPTTVTYKGSSTENKNNLADTFLDYVIGTYGGTSLGAQELDAEILDDDKDSLFKRAVIEANTVKASQLNNLPNFIYIVVAVDPAMSVSKRSAETGICVAAYGEDDHFYVLELEGEKLEPLAWAKKVLSWYDEYQADCIIAEVNQGGDLVINNIKQIRPHANIYSISARRGKYLRAEPVAAAYARNKVHHVRTFPKALDQLCNFNPVKNPNDNKDMVDALVYAITCLMEKSAVGYTSMPSLGGIRSKLLNYQTR
jgi:phage terminase large subunit-like protein